MKWKLTRNEHGNPEIDFIHAEGEPRYSFSLLHEMAKDPANHMEEIEPGVFQLRKDAFGLES